MRSAVARSYGASNRRFLDTRAAEAAAHAQLADSGFDIRTWQATRNSRSVAEVAGMLGVKAATVVRYSYARNGADPVLPPFVVAGERRFRLVDIEAYQARRDAYLFKVAEYRERCAARQAERAAIDLFRRQSAHRDPTFVGAGPYRQGDLVWLDQDGAAVLMRVFRCVSTTGGFRLSLDPALDRDADGLALVIDRSGAHPQIRRVVLDAA